MGRVLKSEKGVTLIELIAAITIISIILLGFMTFFTQNALFSAKNEDSLIATNLAKQVLEELKTNSDTSYITNDEVFTTFNSLGNPTISLVNDDGTFTKYPEYQLKLTFSKEQNATLYIVKIEILETTNQTITETYGYLEVAGS